MIKTLRPIEGGWVNQIGLRNPGVRAVPWNTTDLFSIAPIDQNDIWEMVRDIPESAMLEFNVNCPNHQQDISNVVLDDINFYAKRQPFVSVKVGPTKDMSYLSHLLNRLDAVKYFHCSNTIPSSRGGMSGPRLVSWNRYMIPFFVRNGKTVIAGGGIYSSEQVKIYRDLGAAHFSLSTVFFTPWRIPGIIQEIGSGIQCHHGCCR